MKKTTKQFTQTPTIEELHKRLAMLEKQNAELGKPVLDAFLAWLKIQEKNVLPKSGFGKAIQYCLN